MSRKVFQIIVSERVGELLMGSITKRNIDIPLLKKDTYNPPKFTWQGKPRYCRGIGLFPGNGEKVAEKVENI